METNNWRPAAPGGDSSAEAGSWRSQLQTDARQRIVDKIMETLKKHLPCSGQEGLQELRRIAVRFEEKIYSAAVSQPDYLRKISLKMLTMENKSQSTMPNSVPSNSATSGNRIPDGASHGIPSQVQNQVQSHAQSVSQNVQNSMAAGGVQNSTNMASSLPSVPSMGQTPMSNVAGLNNNMQNMPSISQTSSGNQLGQAVQSNAFSNSQRQMTGRQQVVQQQQQPGQSQNSQYLYQQQLQQQLMKPKFSPGNHPQPLMSSHVQQQQSMLQPSQQTVVQQGSVMQPSIMQNGSIAGLQQNQPSSVQQSTPTMMQQQPQPVQRQPQQSAMMHQQQSQLMKQQLLGQQSNASGMQQNSLMGQQNGMGEMQQQQQQRMLQQNGLQNSQQQQQMISQQSNMSAMHSQQLSSQNNVALQQQQHLLGSQSSNSNLSANQQSVHMLQQSKVPMQQQAQIAGSGLLNPQGQQPQSQVPQQQLVQMQSSATQLQQHLAMQQQPNAMQRDLQQRLQGQGHSTSTLLQSPSMMDQQKQLYQSQRSLPDPSSSLDSGAQSGQVNVGDWQEEAYQKVKQMKEAYLADLSDMYQKLSAKIQHNEAMPQQPKIDNNSKLKVIKQMVERLMQVLQLSKSDITPIVKDKLDAYERQIISFVINNRPRKPGLPQVQTMNLPGSAPALPMTANSIQLQHNSLPSISGVSTSQQNLINPLQPSLNMDSGQVNSMNSLQQVGIGTSQPNSVGMPQQPLSAQNPLSMLQANITMQQNSNMLSHQQMKQHQEQQLLQSQQMKQQFQQRQVQQLMQKQQQMHHQVKQQLPAQMPNQQIQQLHHLNDVIDMKVRPTMKTSTFQQHPSSAQRTSYPHQQLKSGNSFTISSPQILQTASPQIPQHQSPQIDQQSMLSSLTKTGTPLQSASSPFVVPSPSTPLAPSPMPGDSEKPISGSTSMIAHQQTQTAPTQGPGPSLAIGTPGISASPLLAEFTGADAHGATLVTASGKPNLVEQPIERLVKAVKSLSPKALTSAVSDIGSVVTMIDRIAGSAPGNGSRAAVGEDLVAMTKCRLQARNCVTQDGLSGTRRMKRHTSAMPLNVLSSTGSFSDSFKQLTGSETTELESTATSRAKRPRNEGNHALLEEIRNINHRLIDTVVDISEEDVDSSAAIANAEGGEGTVVKCSFTAVALSPNLKSQYASAQFLSPIQPLRLLIPASYPNCSPILLDKLSTETKDHEDLSAKAKSRFSIYLRSIPQPMSLGDIARTWDICARTIISEHTQQMGGGSFSSKYGTWENCIATS